MPDGSTQEDMQFSIAKKSYKMAETDFVTKNACVPHIELCDNWIVNKGNGFKVIDKKDVDFLQEKNLGSAADEDEEE